MMGNPDQRLMTRLYSRLVRLVLPPQFYDDFGSQIVDSFESLYADAAQKSRMARVRLLIRELRSVCGTAWRERRRVRTASGRRRRFGFVDHVVGDIRLSVRGLWRTRGLTCAVILTISLGVGVTAAIFALVDHLLLRALPFPDGNALGSITVRDTRPGGGSLGSSQPEIDDIAGLPSVADAVGYEVAELNFTDGANDPIRVQVVRTSGDLVGLLGLSPTAGRSFTHEELEERRHLVLLSHHLWSQRYGRDTNVLGTSVSIQGVPYTVVGVMPPTSVFPLQTDLWTIDGPYPGGAIQGVERSDRRYAVVARLEADALAETIDVQLETLARRLGETHVGTNQHTAFAFRPLRDVLTGTVRVPLLLLLGAALFVFLIACANVASLLLVRTTSRTNEFAVRKALGASATRLRTQVVAETLTLALSGALLGLVTGGLFLSAIQRVSPIALPFADTIHVDLRIVFAMVGVVALMGILVGLIPAFGSVDRSVSHGLRARGASGSKLGRRWQSALVIGEIALATALAVSATLLVVSLQRLYTVDPGFDKQNLITLRLHNGTNGAGPVSFWQEVVSTVSDIPGVTVSAAAAFQPLERGFGQPFSIEGFSFAAQPTADFMPVVGNFLETIGLRLLEGRAFSPVDDGNAPGVAMVNASFVRRYLSERPPIGAVIVKSIPRGPWGQDATLEIIGVVDDMRNRGLAAEAEPMIMVPHAQAPFGYMRLFVRTEADPAAVVTSVRERIWAIDPLLPVDRVEFMDEVIHESVAQERFMTVLGGSFAALALILAALGVLGVVGYSVKQRTREMGIRIALGAADRKVIGLVMRQTLLLASCGVLTGLVGAYAIGGLLESQLYEIQPTDPRALFTVGLILLTVTLLAGYGPARRVASLDPVAVLRSE